MIFWPRARSFFGFSAPGSSSAISDHRIDHAAQQFDVLEIEIALALQRGERRGEQGHRVSFLRLTAWLGT